MIDRRTFLASLSATGLSLGQAWAQSARTGMFSGRSNHDTTGTAILEGRTLTLGDDFVLDRAPDPIVGLGRDGKWDPNTFMGELMQKRGTAGLHLAGWHKCGRLQRGLYLVSCSGRPARNRAAELSSVAPQLIRKRPGSQKQDCGRCRTASPI